MSGIREEGGPGRSERMREGGGEEIEQMEGAEEGNLHCMSQRYGSEYADRLAQGCLLSEGLPAPSPSLPTGCSLL